MCSYNVSLPLNENEELSRKCNECKKDFTIKEKDLSEYLDMDQVSYPFCGFKGEFIEFNTDSQDSIIGDGALDFVEKEIEKNLSRINRKININIKY